MTRRPQKLLSALLAGAAMLAGCGDFLDEDRCEEFMLMGSTGLSTTAPWSLDVTACLNEWCSDGSFRTGSDPEDPLAPVGGSLEGELNASIGFRAGTDGIWHFTAHSMPPDFEERVIIVWKIVDVERGLTVLSVELPIHREDETTCFFGKIFVGPQQGAGGAPDGV